MVTNRPALPVMVAAADIGSATVHLLVARFDQDGAVRPLHEESARLMLGGRTTAAGAIPPDAEAAALAVLVRYADIVERFHAAVFLIVATAAVRAATNGEAFVQRLGGVLGRTITIVSPEQELGLAALGAFDGALPATGLFADSGGGSTQVAAIRDGAIAWQRSLPVGASTLTRSELHHDPPTADEVHAAVAAIERALAALPPPPTPGVWQPVVTGGSATTIGGFGLGGCVPGFLSPSCLAAVAALTLGQPSAVLATRYGLTPARARILGAGCLILQQLLAWSKAGLWQIRKAGLREGCIRAWVANPERWLAVTGRQDGGSDAGARGEHEA